ncbi:PadR family transcriptional regulator [Agromyces aerolatus]|uniref:PadR family transcriptional regulator n=1 Tax=Agromyces sp. LY-1074 TaxID=3074080 RepID=UPI0028638284|nr:MULTISPECIES: PadR family transcriptional regulator [unclassified Agromyces]MDR5700184.1 PadR family transcriptional regulator [Agromyces sp. LY-1074]MDR5706448.1 PadR family transcriptional regulator [Agromyces sp. LY-1358]
MAVRDALLGILLIGPAYGFQLHGELAARTGGRRTINVGQTYGTLDRLAARALIEPAGATDDGLPLHRLTEAGRVEALAWLHGTDASVSDPWDETVDRVLLSASLPGVELAPILAGERRRWAERLEAAGAVSGEASVADEASPPGEAAVLARHAAAIDRARAGALIDWLDSIAAAPPPAFGFADTRPKRGRRRSTPAQPASA